MEELCFRYVLLGKFQTDGLEARFGKYRQLCGAQYHISITQLFEAEAKLRLQDTLILEDFPEASKGGEKEPNPEVLLAKYNIPVLDSELKKPRTDMPAVAYIAGYCAHAALKRQPCEDCCMQLTVAERVLDQSENVLIDEVNRGGLKFPQPFVVHAVLCTKVVLEHCTSDEYLLVFHKENNQRLSLLSIMMFLLSDSEGLEMCASGHCPDVVLKNILRPAVNTLLKNYASTRNDALTKAKLSVKQRKVLTLK